MAMDLKDVVTTSGHGGLCKSLKPTTCYSLAVENLGDEKKRSIKQKQNHGIATLKDISVYTTSRAEALPLSTILGWASNLYDTPDKLRTPMERIVFNHDPKRVYAPNIKKIIHGYHLFIKHALEFFSAEAQETPSNSLT